MKKWKYLSGDEFSFNGAFIDKEYAIKRISDGRIFFPDNILEVDLDLYSLIGQRQLIEDEQDLNDCIGAPEGNADELLAQMFKGVADKSSAKMQDFLLNSNELPMHKCIPTPKLATESLIAERGSRYGKFKDGADIMQSLKDAMREVDGWNDLTPSQKEALDMIQHKVGRILNDDPNYDDSWKDIAGYATLIVNELNGEVK